MIRARSIGREAALQALYQIDLRADLLQPLDQDAIEELIEGSELELIDARAFAIELIIGTLANADTIDEELKTVAINWKLDRMAVVDRNILRLGTFELLHRPNIPPAVSINEAVMLAKKFSTKDSGAFVNGILDKVHLRHDESAAVESEATE